MLTEKVVDEHKSKLNRKRKQKSGAVIAREAERKLICNLHACSPLSIVKITKLKLIYAFYGERFGFIAKTRNV